MPVWIDNITVRIFNKLINQMKKALLVSVTLFLFVPAASQPKDSIRLFRKCSNMLFVTYFYPQYKPATSVLAVKGGRILSNIDNDKIEIMPDSNIVILEVRQNKKLIHSVKMYGIKTPEALVFAKINGKSVFTHYKSKGAVPTSIELIAEPDASFADELPRDSKYRVTEWALVVMRGNRELMRSIFKESRISQVELNKLRQIIRSGDVVQLEILSVKRKNAAGEMIPEEPAERTIAYTVE
jgi:hypothetical protein